MITVNIKNQCLNEEVIFKQKTKHELKEKTRIKATGEVFTPTKLVLEILEKLPTDSWDSTKTYLDPTCGNGQFLAAVAITKRELGHKNYLSTIYGVDLMQDNVDETRQRLLAIAGDTKENRDVVEKNILCKDGLEYDYSFGEGLFHDEV